MKKLLGAALAFALLAPFSAFAAGSTAPGPLSVTAGPCTGNITIGAGKRGTIDLALGAFSKTGSYTILPTDQCKVGELTGTTASTFTLPALAAHLFIPLQNNSTQGLTLDAGANFINGVHSLSLPAGSGGTLTSEGTKFTLVMGGGASSAVIDVFGRTGHVTLTAADISGAGGLLADFSNVSNQAAARSALGLGTAATQALAAFLQPTNSLSDLTNIAAARANLKVDQLTTQGDAAVTIAATTRAISTSAAFTAPRIWTMPLANSVNPGQPVYVYDAFGGVTSTNTLTISRQTADTIDGGTTAVINAARGGIAFESDGVSKWTVIANVAPFTAVAHQWLVSWSPTTGFVATQPNFSDLFGTINTATQMPASGVTAGAYTCPSVTYDARGLATAATNGTCGTGTPGGSSGDVQVNNGSGGFSGATPAGGLTISGTKLIATAPDATKTTGSPYNILDADKAGQLNYNATNYTTGFNAALSSSYFQAGSTICLVNFNATGLTVTSTPTVNGIGAAGSIGLNGFTCYDSNGTSLDTFGFPGYAQAPVAGAIVKYSSTGGILSTSGLSDDGTTITSAENVDIKAKAVLSEVPNSSTGTAQFKIAKLTGAFTAITVATTDTDGLGIVQLGQGTSGNALIAISGQGTCTFDGATTQGHYVQISGTVAGDCHDAGATFPSSGGRVLGQVQSTNGAGGNFAVSLYPPGVQAGGSGGTTTITPSASVAVNGSNSTACTTNCTLTLTTGTRDVTTNDAFVAADMGSTINLTGTTSGQTLTVNAITTSIFANKQISCYANLSTQNWTIASGAGAPTIVGLPSTTIYPGGGGCFVSDGTAIKWQPGRTGDEARQNAVNTFNQQTNFAAAVDIMTQAIVAEIANDTTTGTTQFFIAKITGAPSKAVKAATSDVDNILGVVMSATATSGNAQVAVLGIATCAYDGATFAGDYVVPSVTTAGKCHDTGTQTRPLATIVIGRATTTNGAAGNFAIFMTIGFTNSSGGGSGTVNTGTINQIAYFAANGTAVSGETLLQCLNVPALTGDVTSAGGTCATTVSATIAKLNANQTFTKGQMSSAIPVTDGATVTLDLTQGNVFVWTIAGTGRNLVNPTMPANSMTFLLEIIEDGTGSRTITTYGTFWKFSGGTKPTLSTAAAAIDAYSCFVPDTTHILCSSVANFQ